LKDTDAGIVDENVNASEILIDQLKQSYNLISVGYIHRETYYFRPISTTEPRERLLDTGLRPAANGDRSSSVKQMTRNGEPNASRSARNNRLFSRKKG
jgi:hypothetical protein